jgi:hypothetical protein
MVISFHLCDACNKVRDHIIYDVINYLENLEISRGDYKILKRVESS